MVRDLLIHDGIAFISWPEHGCWYEIDAPNEVGRLHIPMSVDGSPVLEDMGEIEVLWEEA